MALVCLLFLGGGGGGVAHGVRRGETGYRKH